MSDTARLQVLDNGNYLVKRGPVQVTHRDGREMLVETGTILSGGPAASMTIYGRQRIIDVPEGLDPDIAVLFIEALMAERVRAHDKHGHTSMEQTGLLEHRRASILTEEAVECAKALNDYEHDGSGISDDRLYSDAWAGCDALDKEVVQTGAMAYTWFANRRGDQLPAVEPPPKLPLEVLEVLVEAAGENYVSTPASRQLAQTALDKLGVKR